MRFSCHRSPVQTPRRAWSLPSAPRERERAAAFWAPAQPPHRLRAGRAWAPGARRRPPHGRRGRSVRYGSRSARWTASHVWW